MDLAATEAIRLLTPFRYRCSCGHPVSARTGQAAVDAMRDHLHAMRHSGMMDHAPIDWPSAVIGKQ